MIEERRETKEVRGETKEKSGVRGEELRDPSTRLRMTAPEIEGRNGPW